MTIKELIEELDKYPQDMIVSIPFHGDGGGYERVYSLEKRKVSRYSRGGGSYYGELTEYKENDEDKTCKISGQGSKEVKMFSDHFEIVVIG